MKCFEIYKWGGKYDKTRFINRKHEMFWNDTREFGLSFKNNINRKHEMFWNKAFYLVVFSIGGD